MTMTQQTAFASVSQSFIDRTITLAGFTILRLVRSPLAQHLDLAAGEKAFFQAVQFLKNVALQQGDIGFRTALIMNDLWGSSRVFRRKDGRIESLGLRLRTRLSMSVSYDMFWYWREEFGHMQNPYNGEETIGASNDATQPSTPREYFHLSLLSTSLMGNLAYVSNQAQGLPNSSAQSQAPISKFDPSLVNPQLQPDPTVMSFDGWDGSEYSAPPMLDQFPDYDWAAGFDFSNSDFPTIPVGPMNTIVPGGNPVGMGYTFG
ncbi:hypothetical protein N0V83_001418 [Neocucurbitaria cava]|uniref:Uncharacterized protein n=1 Tax=Neocucurbitaria cava TaxID=798079 RepID=A0A9W8YG57_9PLEO|nr:hypothetical protein N0V83_001418 [Neocucurbitaria cava]